MTFEGVRSDDIAYSGGDVSWREGCMAVKLLLNLGAGSPREEVRSEASRACTLVGVGRGGVGEVCDGMGRDGSVVSRLGACVWVRCGSRWMG